MSSCPLRCIFFIRGRLINVSMINSTILLDKFEHSCNMKVSGTLMIRIRPWQGVCAPLGVILVSSLSDFPKMLRRDWEGTKSKESYCYYRRLTTQYLKYRCWKWIAMDPLVLKCIATSSFDNVEFKTCLWSRSKSLVGGLTFDMRCHVRRQLSEDLEWRRLWIKCH